FPVPMTASDEVSTQPGGSKPGPNQGTAPGRVDLIIFEPKWAGMLAGERHEVMIAHFYELKPIYEAWDASRAAPENRKTTWDRQLQNYLVHDPYAEFEGQTYESKAGTILERYRAIVQTPFPVVKGDNVRWYWLRLPPGANGTIDGLIEYSYKDVP